MKPVNLFGYETKMLFCTYIIGNIFYKSVYNSIYSKKPYDKLFSTATAYKIAKYTLATGAVAYPIFQNGEEYVYNKVPKYHKLRKLMEEVSNSNKDFKDFDKKYEILLIQGKSLTFIMTLKELITSQNYLDTLKFTDDEFKACIAHEFTHVSHYHALISLFLNTFLYYENPIFFGIGIFYNMAISPAQYKSSYKDKSSPFLYKVAPFLYAGAIYALGDYQYLAFSLLERQFEYQADYGVIESGYGLEFINSFKKVEKLIKERGVKDDFFSYLLKGSLAPHPSEIDRVTAIYTENQSLQHNCSTIANCTLASIGKTIIHLVHEAGLSYFAEIKDIEGIFLTDADVIELIG